MFRSSGSFCTSYFDSTPSAHRVASKGIRIKRLCVIINPLCNSNMPQECRGRHPFPECLPRSSSTYSPSLSLQLVSSFLVGRKTNERIATCNMPHATYSPRTLDFQLRLAKREQAAGGVRGRAQQGSCSWRCVDSFLVALL